MSPKANVYNSECPSQSILAMIGSKWSLLTLCSLRGGALRSRWRVGWPGR